MTKENKTVVYRADIEFSFKESRDYVHGTDIFDHVIEHTKRYFATYPDYIKGSFHRRLRHHGILSIYEDGKEPEIGRASAYFETIVKGRRFFTVISNSNKSIDTRKEYKEEMIISQTWYENKEIHFTCGSEFSYIEQIVPVTKELHRICYPDAQGKWFFTKIELIGKIDPIYFINSKLSIKAEKNLYYKLTENRIKINDIDSGSIWFSIVK